MPASFANPTSAVLDTNLACLAKAAPEWAQLDLRSKAKVLRECIASAKVVGPSLMEAEIQLKGVYGKTADDSMYALSPGMGRYLPAGVSLEC